jgi:hypothetical protein
VRGKGVEAIGVGGSGSSSRRIGAPGRVGLHPEEGGSLRGGGRAETMTKAVGGGCARGSLQPYKQRLTCGALKTRLVT